jgi:hypothetical protein
VWGSSDADVYVVGDGIFHSTDHGANWLQVTTIPPSVVLGSAHVWGSSASDIYVVGTCQNCVLHSPDGFVWSEAGRRFEPRDAVWGSSRIDVYAVGDPGIVHTDGFSGWQDVGTSTDVIRGTPLNGIWGTGPDDILVVGGGGVIFRGTNQGTIWTPIDSGTMKHLVWIWGTTQSVYAVGIGAVLFSSDDGSTWNDISPPEAKTGTLMSVWGASDNDVYTAGENGLLLHRTNGSWEVIPTDTADYLGSVWGSRNDDVYVVGGSGVILHFAPH